MGASVRVLDTNVDRLRHIDETYRGEIRTITSNKLAVEQADTYIKTKTAPNRKSA